MKPTINLLSIWFVVAGSAFSPGWERAQAAVVDYASLQKRFVAAEMMTDSNAESLSAVPMVCRRQEGEPYLALASVGAVMPGSIDAYIVEKRFYGYYMPVLKTVLSDLQNDKRPYFHGFVLEDRPAPPEDNPFGVTLEDDVFLRRVSNGLVEAERNERNWISYNFKQEMVWRHFDEPTLNQLFPAKFQGKYEEMSLNTLRYRASSGPRDWMPNSGGFYVRSQLLHRNELVVYRVSAVSVSGNLYSGINGGASYAFAREADGRLIVRIKNLPVMSDPYWSDPTYRLPTGDTIPEIARFIDGSEFSKTIYCVER